MSEVNDSWELVSEGPWTKRRKPQAITWRNQILLLGGFDGESAFDLNDVWSYDGTQWTMIDEHAQWSGRDGHTVVVLNDEIFLIGGTDDPFYCKNDVWKSLDGGHTWNELIQTSPWPERWQHASCVHREKIFISGGWGEKYLNDVWCSSDGHDWELVCKSTPWKPRMFHSMINFQDDLYVLAGHDGKNQLNDIWKSADNGRTWISIKDSAPWTPRQGHCVIVVNDQKIFLMGGFGNNIRLNDLWQSDDGVTWQCKESSCGWTPRQGHAGTFYQNYLYIFGGFDSQGYCNQTYKSYLEASRTNSMDFSSISPMSLKKGKKELCKDDENQTLSYDQMNQLIGLIIEYREYKQFKSELSSDVYTILELINRTIKCEIDPENRNRRLSSVDSMELNDSLSFAKRLSFEGSPFQENALEKLEAKRSKSNETLQQQLNQGEDILLKIHPPTAIALKTTIIHNNPTNKPLIHWDNIESEKKELISLQKEIRQVACNDQLDLMNTLIIQRKELAQQSLNKVEELDQQLLLLLQDHEEHKVQLDSIISLLENNLLKLQNHSLLSYSEILSLSEREYVQWDKIIDKLPEVLSSKPTTNTLDRDIQTFVTSFQTISSYSQDILTLLSSENFIQSTFSLDQSDDLGPDNESTETPSPKNSSIDTTVKDYHQTMTIQCEIASHILENLPKEQEYLRQSLLDIAALLYSELIHGKQLIQKHYIRHVKCIMDTTAFKKELEAWKQSLIIWIDQDQLQEQCKLLIKDISLLEDQLIQEENLRIDLKSNLEKALLQSSRHKRGGNNSNISPTHSDQTINQLKQTLQTKEKITRQYRKSIRNWYRDKKSFVRDKAPELYHYLPDFRSPGSVLGDGGFAETANIPHRLLSDYDEIAKFIPDDLRQSGRHLLLTAKYENSPVILKGFVMQNNEQRKGMDREIAILSKLNNDFIISPQAIVESQTDDQDLALQISLFIEYPYYQNGNLSSWIKASPRKPWEIQSIARQILYGLLYLHDHGIVHKDIKPSNILLQDDGKIVLTDFELAKCISSSNATNALEEDEEFLTTSRAGTIGYMAPEVERGGHALFASDMYSFGMLLYFLYYPNEAVNLLPGQVNFPLDIDADLANLVANLIHLDPLKRPSASTALSHPFFSSTFVDRLMQEGEIVDQDRKLDAVRSLMQRTKAIHRNIFEKITVRRTNILADVLEYFIKTPLERLRLPLKVTFVDEPGVDEGGLLTEVFFLFFQELFQSSSGLFEDCNGIVVSSTHTSSFLQGSVSPGQTTSNPPIENNVYLPSKTCESNEEALEKLEAIGKIFVKVLYEGKRIGNKLSPVVFKFFTNANPNMQDLQLFDPQLSKSLQWLLTSDNVDELGFHFESVGASELGIVNDTNKTKFVRMKLEETLVNSRLKSLKALKKGFLEGWNGISTEAAPFIPLLSHTDWRIMLCGDTLIDVQQILDCMIFSNFPRRSKISQWIKEILLAASEDYLRKFLIFVTGTPSLSASFLSSRKAQINVRCQTRSQALPSAHTCFFFLDIPDYQEKQILQNKLLFAIQNANTYELV